jgi:SET domain-containing protein
LKTYQDKMSETDQNTIQAPESDYLYVATSQLPNSGNGLFTAIAIYKDEIISEFKGEVLSDEEAEIRVKNGTDQYFMNLLNGSILDCRNTDCFAKYANDANGFSKSDFKNNAKITLDENQSVCLIAIKKLKSGEEILCDYGKKYWKKHKY